MAKIYESSVAAANRRDVPAYSNTTGSLLSAVAWATDGNRKGWARYDSSTRMAYWDIEALSSTSVRVYSKTQLGSDTTADVTVAASTAYTTLIPGLSITMAGTITTGHISRIYAATYGDDDATIFCPKDQASDARKFIFENNDVVDYMRTTVVIGRGTWYENTSGTAITKFAATGPCPIADTYAVTIANGTSSGKKVTFTGAHNTYSRDNVAVGSSDVPIDDSDTTHLIFSLSAGAGNTDTATCYVSDLADCEELAPDNSGTPGTYVTFDSSLGVVLPINVPAATDQLIPAAQTVTFWRRINPDASFNIGRGNSRMYADYQVAE